MLHVGLKLRVLREFLNIDQKELATNFGFSLSAMSNIETDKRPNPTGLKIAEYAHVMHMSPEYFYLGVPPAEYMGMEKVKILAYKLSQLPSFEHWKKVIDWEYEQLSIEKNKAENKFQIDPALFSQPIGKNKRTVTQIDPSKYGIAQEGSRGSKQIPYSPSTSSLNNISR